MISNPSDLEVLSRKGALEELRRCISELEAENAELKVFKWRISELEVELKAGHEEWSIGASLYMEKIGVLKKKKADLFTENFDLKCEIALFRQDHKSSVKKQEQKKCKT